MREAPRRTPCLLSLLISVLIAAQATSALGQVANSGPPCVAAPSNLQTIASRLNRVWGTRAGLLVCDGTRVPFGSQAKPGTVYFVPEQAHDLRFDGLGVLYIIAHEWGHQVQFQRLGMANMFNFSQQREFQADCLAGYFIGATLPYAPDTERRLMSAAAAIGDDRILHSSRLAGPFGNLIDQFTTSSPHGNAQGRASFVQVGYRDGRERGIVSCAIVTANLR
jgi:hypothetical protein